MSNYATGNKLFAVFGGGWSSIRYKVSYDERYRPMGGNNEFSSRMAAVLYSSSGATSKPYITLNGVTHNNGGHKRTFSYWNNASIMYGSEWDVGYGRENTESVVYPSNANVSGKLSFLLICNGGTLGIVPDSVDLSLKTY